MSSLIGVILIGLLVWFWVDSLRVRERALVVCANACRQLGYQFLDQTVALTRLGLGRDGRGHVKIRRHYAFEFSTQQVDRLKGNVVLLGASVESLHMDHPEGVTIFGSGQRASDDAPQ